MATTSYKSNLEFTVKRFLGFLKSFRRSRRGVFGIGIIAVFSFLAIAAPLLTPNDPTWDDYVSSDYAQPVWFKYLPGGENIAEDVYPIKDPSFNSPDSLLGTSPDWNTTITTDYPALSKITVDYSGDVGRPTSSGGSGVGSAKIVFQRTDVKRPGRTVTVRLSNNFYYPYKAPPERFTANVTVFASGAEYVPVEARVLLTNSSGFKFYLWTPTEITNTTLSWAVPATPVDSYESDMIKRIETFTGRIGSNPAKVLVPTKGYYQYSFEVIFTDTSLATLNQDISVYVDDLSLRLYGNAYGPLGTDQRGRDLWSQLIYGSRISLFVGLLSAVLSVVIGLFAGLIAGYLGKVVDEILMRFTDALLVLPSLPLLIVLIAVLGPSLTNLVMVIGVLGWMGFARMVRAQTLSLRERPFVEAAKAVGAGKWHIISRHILPNVMSLVYVSLALSVPSAILSEAALSWLGLANPNDASWGRMLYDAQSYQGVERWWWVVPPGVSIALLSLSFILMGYALDEMLNPKLRQRR